MEQKAKEIIFGIEEMIKTILPHTGNFHKEVKLLSKKAEFFQKIDVLLEKYDEMIKELEQDSKK
jgi:hypothetical protein